MTFIVGLRCFDGLVLVSEELESDNVTKRYRQKLHIAKQAQGWGLVWGGSGLAYVVDKFGEKLKELMKVRRTYERVKIESEIELCLQFIRKQYARASDQIDVVLGLFGPDELSNNIPEFHLYKGSSESACIAAQKEYCVAGMDCTLAVFVLENCRNPFGCVSEASRLGFLVTTLMNKYADGCDGPIDCFTYRLGDSSWEPMGNSKLVQNEKDFPLGDMENAIGNYWREHPKAINNDETTETHLRVRLPKKSVSRKSKPGQ